MNSVFRCPVFRWLLYIVFVLKFEIKGRKYDAMFIRTHSTYLLHFINTSQNKQISPKLTSSKTAFQPISTKKNRQTQLETSHSHSLMCPGEIDGNSQSGYSWIKLT